MKLVRWGYKYDTWSQLYAGLVGGEHRGWCSPIPSHWFGSSPKWRRTSSVVLIGKTLEGGKERKGHC